MKCKLKVSGIFDAIFIKDDNIDDVIRFIENNGYIAKSYLSNGKSYIIITKEFTKTAHSSVRADIDKFVVISDDDIFVIGIHEFVQLFEKIGE